MSQTIENTFGDIQAEEYLAALVVKDVDSRELIVDEISLEMFSTPVAHAVFGAVCSLMVEQMTVDDTALVDRLTGKIDRPEITIGLLRGQPVSAENVNYYVKRVRDCHNRKRMAEVFTDGLNRLNSGQVVDVDRFRSEVEESLLKDFGPAKRKTLTFGESLDIIRKAKQKGGDGYSWGIRKLDHATGGISPGRYYAIGGLKKTGKSLFGIHTIVNLVLNPDRTKRIPCLMISLEMSDHQFNCSMLSNVAKVNSRKFGTPYIDADELMRCDLAAEKLDKCPLYLINQPGMSVDQILAAIRRHVRRGVKVVVIDYLQRIDIPNKGDTRATAIQKAVNKLADGARKFDVALLLLSQLANRAEFDSGPGIGDFKESGGIAEACDCALMLNNLDRNQKDANAPKQNKMEIFIPVQRVGLSNSKITVRHDLRFAQFFDESEIAESPISTCNSCGQNVWLEEAAGVPSREVQI